MLITRGVQFESFATCLFHLNAVAYLTWTPVGVLPPDPARGSNAGPLNILRLKDRNSPADLACSTFLEVALVNKVPHHSTVMFEKFNLVKKNKKNESH